MNQKQAEPAAARTVLVVDDDADIRLVLAEFLEEEGYAVAGAANGHEALAWLRQYPRPSVILLDLMMPIMDGYRFRQAQKGDASLESIPVVVMTARGAIEPGVLDVDTVLPKPLELDSLLDALATAARR